MNLERFYRAGDMPCIAFQGKGPSFHLHAQCPIRLTDESRMLIGVSDMYEPGSKVADRENYDNSQDWDSLYDERTQAFLAEGEHRVIAASVSIYGDVNVKLTGGYELTVTPYGTTHDEEWRFSSRTRRSTAYIMGTECLKRNRARAARWAERG